MFMSDIEDYRKLILRIGEYAKNLDPPADLIASALISVAVFMAIRALGKEHALEWLSRQVNIAVVTDEVLTMKRDLEEVNEIVAKKKKMVKKGKGKPPFGK